MKEATGEVSMTVVTLVAIAIIGGILAFMWPTIQNRISSLWDNASDDQGQSTYVNSPGTTKTTKKK